MRRLVGIFTRKEGARMRDFSIPTRSAAIAEHGMAATSNPLATLAAIDMLREGGNAIDAAITAVAVQSVVEPHMTGIGGDCFVVYSPMAGTPLAFNGSGRAPAGAECEWYWDRNFSEIPEQSPHAVTVPGAIDAWCRLLADHGTKELYVVLKPAIRLAEDGFRVTPRVAHDWARKRAKLSIDPDTARQYMPDGHPPKPGDRFRQPELAATLRKISRQGRAAFYEGEIAAEIVEKLRSLGGLHRPEDFAAHAGNYVEPISALYRGFEIYECPPNGQGLAVLIMLRALSGYDLSGPRFDEADRIHLLAEVTKAAYGLRDAYLCDPEHHPLKVTDFLSEGQEQRLLRSIRPDLALPATPRSEIDHKDTVYLAVVDRDRNAVSFINSLFSSFGSGLYAAKSGVLLHNRGHSFRVCPGHPNAIAPGKRPMHTIIPAMMLKKGRAVMPFGVTGGDYQAAGQVHFLSQILDRGLDPQEAAEVPRFFAYGGVLQLEKTIPDDIATELARRGHEVQRRAEPLGGCQAVWIDHSGGFLMGASDPRKDGIALGY
jgi:gamma-glutamyltranspeptidase/glutathione hydrolase